MTPLPTMPLPSERRELMNDALAVLDRLAEQTPGQAPLTPEARKAQLIALVTEVSRQNGRDYDDRAIHTAVAALLTERQQTALAQLPPSPVAVRAARSVGQSLRSWGQRTVRRWRTTPALRRITKGVLGSVTLAVLVVGPPSWGAVLQAPFVLAYQHPSAFIAAMIVLVGVLGTLGHHAEKTHRTTLAGWMLAGTMVTVLGGSIGGIVANVWARDTRTAGAMQRDFSAVNKALTAVTARLKPEATTEDVLKAGDAEVGTHWFTGSYNEERQSLQEWGNLTQAECRQMQAHPDAQFHLVSVNDQAVSDGTLACPYLWENAVVFERALPTPPTAP